MNVVEVDSLTKPAWVDELFGEDAETTRVVDENLRVEHTQVKGLCYIQAVLADAIDLDTRDFERRVTEVYAALRDGLEGRPASYPLRFWNFVPGIHRPAHDGMVGYEVFNAGRFQAFADWYQTPSFGPRMIAASGVGHHSPDFVVQVLAAECPGQGLENPRQRAAYNYSKRYGPLPPCFARATVVGDTAVRPEPGLMIVAGTASVVGEDSLHDGNLEKQFSETCLNLESLIRVAASSAASGDSDDDPLSLFRELRAYVVDESSHEPLIEMLEDRFTELRHLEIMPADLCRTDLMVEVEGVAHLAPTVAS